VNYGFFDWATKIIILIDFLAFDKCRSNIYSFIILFIVVIHSNEIGNVKIINLSFYLGILSRNTD
jgi:hypothetical protein